MPLNHKANERRTAMDEGAYPKRFASLKRALEQDNWNLDRISGSHHIFTKPGRRCIPVAFHGGTVSRRYASLVLRQAGRDESGLQTSAVLGAVELTPEHEPTTSAHEGDRKVRAAPKPVRKAELEKNQRAQVQRQQLRQDFKAIQREEQLEQEAESEERIVQLESMQGFIASGDYKGALELYSSSLSKFEGHSVGSSSEWHGFHCDLLFYRIITLSEYAMTALPFNSQEQRNMLKTAFGLAARFIESSTGRREESRKLAVNLRERVFSKYMHGLMAVQREYLVMSLQLSKNSPEKVYSYLDGTTRAELAIANQPTSAEFHALLDNIVDGFEFAVDVADANSIAMTSSMTLSPSENVMLASMVDICIRKMLIRFDFRDYDCAKRLADTLLMFAAQHAEGLQYLALFQGMFHGIVGIPPPRKHDQIRAMAMHVQAMIPIYEFANKSLKWYRLSGMIAEDSIPTDLLPKGTDLHMVVEFIDRLFGEFDRLKDSITAFVEDHRICKFLVDTLSEPVYLTHFVLDQALFEPNSDASRCLMRYIKRARKDKTSNVGAQSFDEFALSSSAQFRKGKYDNFRVKLARLLLVQLKVLRLYDDVLAVPSFAKSALVSSACPELIRCRFEYMPNVLMRITVLLNLVFGPENETVSLLRYGLILRNDIDMANYFFVETSNGVLVGHGETAGSLESPEAVRAFGNWSFNLVFRKWAVLLLARAVVDNEGRKLRVIKSIAHPGVMDRYLEHGTIEALAFDTISKLHLVRDVEPLSVNDTQKLLLGILNDPMNKSWCHSFKGEGERKRWAKDKSRKYHRIVERARLSFVKAKMETCLDSRTTCVTYLLDRLQECVLKSRRLPKELILAIEQTESPTNLIKASNYIKQWTLEEARETADYVVQLDRMVEEACGFFSKVSGGAFPQSLSIFNQNWNIRRCADLRDLNQTLATPSRSNTVATDETLVAIRDIRYVKALLEMLLESRKGASPGAN